MEIICVLLQENETLRKLANILVTGGAGFIGCNFIRKMLFEIPGYRGRIINYDNLSYSGNLYSLNEVYEKFFGTRYFFENGDITDRQKVSTVLENYNIDTIVHFAAESHVDRSILGPEIFVKSNIVGTFILLESVREYWNRIGSALEDKLFHHISTDEVYGSLDKNGYFTEKSPYAPHSPYSASKASSDHLVMSYYHTFGLPVTISNCSNNYGPYQFPEKFIPLMILNMLSGKSLPVYGNGKNIRDWIHVDDHNSAIWTIIQKGKEGEKYNIGGDNEQENVKLLNILIDIVATKAKLDPSSIRNTITYIKDRPGHDLRYSIDCSKLKQELGWKQTINFFEGLEHTIDWYINNADWIEKILSREYKNWIEKNYKNRML